MTTEPENEPVEHHPDVRFSLANERTLLAYQRTAIGLIAASVGVLHFLRHGATSYVLTVLLLITGLIASGGGYWRYRRTARAIADDRPLEIGPVPQLMAAAMLLCVVLAAVYIAGHAS